MPPIISPLQLPYLEYYLGGLAVALVIGAFLISRSRARALLPAERFCLLLFPAALFATLVVMVNTIIRAPIYDWNSGRLAPAIGLWYGAKLYVSPFGPGAVMDTIYPPMAYLVYLPAGFFSSPTFSIICASCISAALFFGPAIALSFSRRGEGKKSRVSMVGVLLLLGLVQGAVMSKALYWGAFWIHADAPMLGFAALACMVLYSRRTESMPSLATCLVSGLFASFSVWSKQTAAPLMMALPLWVLLTGGFRAALRYTLWLSAVLAAMTLLFRMIFGVNSILFNIFTIPSSQPWLYQGPLLVDGIRLLLTEYFCASAIFLVSIPLAMVARGIFTPKAEPEPGSEPRPGGWAGLRLWVQRNPWLLFVLVGFALVPTALLSRIKVGGFWNNFGPTPYFLSLGLIAYLLDWHESNVRRGLRPLNAGLALILLVLVIFPASKCSEANFEMFRLMHDPMINSQEEAYRFALSHPGQAYFPSNPLSNLLAEGKYYHHLYGMIDREWAHRRIPDPLLRQHVPASLKYICFCRWEYEANYGWLMSRLPEFNRRVVIPELPEWTCFERDQTIPVVTR